MLFFIFVAFLTHNAFSSFLVFPKNNSLLVYNEVEFLWNIDEAAVSYQIVIATDQNFTTIIKDTTVTANSCLIELSECQSYFWKVGVYNGVFLTWSETRSFSIMNPSCISSVNVWLSSDSLVSIDSSNKVTQWNNIIGSEVFSQPIQSYQPQLVANSFGGYPIIRLDGSDDFLLFDDTLVMASFFGLVNYSNTPFGAWPALISASNGNYLIYGNVGSLLLYIQNLTNDSMYINNIETNNFSPLNVNKLISVFAQAKVLQNLFIGSNIGTGSFWKGDISEIILSSTSLTTNEKNNLYQYIFNKYSPPVNLDTDLNIDYGFCNIELSVNTSYVSYLWSTGSTDDTITVSVSGQYWVQVTDVFGRVSRDTINVQFPHFAFQDTTICIGDTAVFTSTLTGDYGFEWSDASTDSVLKITEAGTYWLKVTDTLGCFLTDTFVVSVDSFSVLTSLGPDISICSGESIGLVSGASQAQEYLWSTGDTTVSIQLQAPGEYSVTVTNAIGCVAQDTVNVTFHGYKPEVGFVADSVCFGLLTSFTDTSSATAPDAIGSWLWTIDGIPFTEQNPEYQFPDPGTHQVQLYVETDSGCWALTTQDVFVIPNPETDFMPVMGCSEKPIQFNNLTTVDWGSVLAWEWIAVDTSDVIVDYSTSTHALFSFTEPMIYDVTLIAVTSDGCRDTITKPVEIRRTPAVDFSWSNICIGQTTAFVETTQVLPHESIILRQWDFGDNGVSVLPNPLHQYALAGTYQVSLYNKSVNGCSDTIVKPVTIYTLPDPGFEYSTPCLNTTVQFYDTSSVSGGYVDHVLWTFPGFDTTSVTSPLYNFPDTGIYTIILTAYSDQGCSASTSQNIQVYPFPKAAFTLTPEYGIPPLEVSFFNESTGADSYSWDFGDGDFSSLINPQHTYLATSVYTVTLVAVNNYLCNDTAYRTVYVIPSTYDVAVSDVELASNNNMITSIVKVKNFGSRIVRSLQMMLQVDNGMPVTEIWEGVMNPGEDMYYIFHSLLDESNLSDRKIICYSAMPNENVEDINMFNNTWCDILDPGFYIMNILPNPTSNQVMIEFVMKETGLYGVQIISSDGRIVLNAHSLQGTEGMNRLLLDLTHIMQGVYAIRISTDTDEVIDRITIAR